MAAIPHAHAGMTDVERQKHDAAPHVHSHSHQHGQHDHDSGNESSGKHHSEEGRNQHEGDQGARSENDSKLVGIFGKFEHDKDAIFIGVQPVAVGVRNEGAKVISQSLIACFVASLEGQIAAWPTLRIEPPWQTPDALKDRSEIYLTLRNLRI